MRVATMFRPPLLKACLLALIHGYRYLISPWLGNRCRFFPSCSEYAEQAIVELGVVKGLTASFWRLLRCHPWHPGGYDPVVKTMCETKEANLHES